jgi:hypothetical protein
VKILLFSLLFSITVSSVFSQTMCPLNTGTEKITNGDFSSGNTGFTSNFTFFAGPGQLPGDEYAIGTNPNPYNTTYFKSMGDHTTGTGNMLIYDFNSSSGSDALWTQTVSVTAGQTYFFSAWFANISINNTTSCGTCPGGTYIKNSPLLQFQITGTPNFTSPIVHVDSLTNNWDQYFTTYTPTATGSITIKIVNLRTDNIGNDLALDDISFRDGCDKITNLSSIGQSSALPDTVYDCNVAFPYTLDPSLPGAYGYAWKLVPGTTLGTGTTYNVASAPADGTKYYLCYSYISGCPRKDSVIFKNTPVTVNLGSDKVICSPVNYTINSGIMAPPATIQWTLNGTSIPGATNSTYTATSTGTYGLTAARAGCTFNTTDVIVISNPASSFAGNGTACNTDNTSTFTVTSGTTQVKWYTVASGGTALNTGDTNPSISPAYASTNTTTPGCTSGLYAEDVSSYSGVTMPTAPCAGSINNDNNAGNYVGVDVGQQITLTSVDFFQNTGWGDPATFTFNIYNNDPTIGPWNGSGRQGGPTGAPIYTTSSGSLSTAVNNTQRTMTTNVVLAPGRYWFNLQVSGGAMGLLGCNQPTTGSFWTTPYVDNTTGTVLKAIGPIQSGTPGGTGGNVTSTGPLFNMKFQVGSSNTCSRLWICASVNCTAPVNFISVNANREGNSNMLVWKTASEMNSSYFTVERSLDGINFSPVGNVAAAGNSSSVLSYNFEDYFSSPGTVYYRIVETDSDGKKTFSPAAVVTAGETSAVLSVYPVPVKKGDVLEIEFTNGSKETIAVEVLDNLGRVVQNSKFSAEAGFNKFQLSTTELPSGAYVVKMTGKTLKIAKILVE